MNLDELRTVQSKERQKDSLQHLRPSFYKEVADYIADLEAERERVAETAADPFASPEVGRLTDEIETAKDVVEAIYERRMGKIVKQASLAAAGMAADGEGLTDEEEDLFDTLVSNIRSNKNRVLDVLEGQPPETTDDTGSTDASAADPSARGHSDPAPARETDADAPPAPPEEPPTADAEPRAQADDGSDGAGADSGVTAADVMGGDGPDPGEWDDSVDGDAPDSTRSEASASRAGEADGPADADSAGEAEGAGEGPPADGTPQPDRDVDRITVRITRDVGSILGVDDREYTLASDDVVTLPERNATPLVERDAAEPLDRS